MAYVNIEIKAKSKNQDAIREILKSRNADFKWVDHQIGWEEPHFLKCLPRKGFYEAAKHKDLYTSLPIPFVTGVIE